jgi:hypothetical protein
MPPPPPPQHQHQHQQQQRSKQLAPVNTFKSNQAPHAHATPGKVAALVQTFQQPPKQQQEAPRRSR